MKILEIKNLCKVYGEGETRVDALKNISFDVDQGEFVAVVGPSGSGKSTSSAAWTFPLQESSGSPEQI